MYLVSSKTSIMNNTAKVLIALAAGAAAGAIMGILFAPAKGEETRENIMKKGKSFADDMAKKFKDLKGDCKEKEEALN
jgi:gas vesicle protein